MKKLLIGLTFLASMSSFASSNDLITDITLKLDDIFSNKLDDIFSNKLKGSSTIENEKQLSFLCGQLSERLENREFGNITPEFAARTLENVCKQSLPSGYSWILKY